MVNSLFEDSLQLDMEQQQTGDPTVLCQTVVVGNSRNPHYSANNDVRVLNFCFLGCEPNMPYGPIPHTAQLVMDIMAQAIEQASSTSTAHRSSHYRRKGEDVVMSHEDEEEPNLEDTTWMLRFKCYNVQKEEYPASAQEWDTYDGIILPGSFSAAYDDEPWIQTLCHVIQTEIVAHRRKTLGICFGHQVLAHSFADGLASKMPQGSRAGRIVLQTTAAGQALFAGQGAGMMPMSPKQQGQELHYYYTHGDRVERLPATAVCLGGDDRVPILAAAYYDTPQQAAQAASGGDNGGGETPPLPKPYAITFQAHPEYASSMDLGLHRTLGLIMDVMVKKELLESHARQSLGEDALKMYNRVKDDSLNTIVSVGRLLGWFP